MPEVMVARCSRHGMFEVQVGHGAGSKRRGVCRAGAIVRYVKSTLWLCESDSVFV